MNYRAAIESTNKVRPVAESTFHGIATIKSYGIKQQIGIQQQQLQHGMKQHTISYNQSTASRGRPHGRNQQQQLHGNVVKMPSTRGSI